MKKNTSLLVVLCLVVVSILAGCNSNKNPQAADNVERVLSVEVGEVVYSSLSDSNRLTGTIKPQTEVEIVPKTSGEIQKIYVKKGDMVKVGETLAKLDDSDERNALAQQKTVLKQAQASLESAQNGRDKSKESYAQSQVAARQAEVSLDDARQSQTDNLDNMEFQISNAESAWKQAKQNLERMNALYEEGLISKQNNEDAINVEKSAKNAYDQVLLAKNQAGNENSFNSLKTSIDQAKIGENIAKSSIKDAEIGIKQAQASVEQAQLAVEVAMNHLKDKVITATASGEIIEINGEVGAMVGQQTFATIVSIDTVKVEANVMSQQLSQFKLGDSVDVEISGQDIISTGTISYVSVVSSGSGLFTIEADVKNLNHFIRPGMLASIMLQEVLVEKAILVPTRAIIEKEGKTLVYVVKDGKAIEKEVEVSRYGTELTAISGELNEKEQVVIKGQNLLEDGDAVKIVEED